MSVKLVFIFAGLSLSAIASESEQGIFAKPAKPQDPPKGIFRTQPVEPEKDDASEGIFRTQPPAPAPAPDAAPAPQRAPGRAPKQHIKREERVEMPAFFLELDERLRHAPLVIDRVTLASECAEQFSKLSFAQWRRTVRGFLYSTHSAPTQRRFFDADLAQVAQFRTWLDQKVNDLVQAENSRPSLVESYKGAVISLADLLIQCCRLSAHQNPPNSQE